MISALRRQDLKDPDLQRHGDTAVMLALGWFATLNLSAAIEFTPVPSHPRGFDNLSAAPGGRMRDRPPGELDDLPALPEPQGW